MSELRPCPLCGGDELGHGFDCPPMEGNVQCYACHLYIVAETEEAAIAAWNRGPSAAPWPERSRRLEAGMSKRPAETVMERLRRSIRLAPHDGVVLADAAFFADVACEIERLAAENVRLREALDSLFTAAHALNDALIGVQMTAPQWHLDALQVATSQMRGAYVIARAALPRETT